MNTYYVELNFASSKALETGIAVSQGDYGNTQFSIATKKDGSFIADAISAEIIFNLTNGYIVTGELEGSGGLYTYTFQGNELQSPGRTPCTVTLHFEDGRTSSEAFVFDVRYNPLYDRRIDAGPYLTEFEKIKNQAQGYVDYLEVLIEQLKQSVGETALTKADLQNDLLQSTPGLKALDAALGSILLTKTDAAEKFASKEDVKGFLTSDIIDNNLLGTDPTHVLASPQGKALADQITQLNSNFAKGQTSFSCDQITLSAPTLTYVKAGKLLYAWFNIKGTFINDDIVVIKGLPFRVNLVSSFLSYQNTNYKSPIRAIESEINATSLKLWVLDPASGKQDFNKTIHGASEIGNVYIGILGIIAD